MINKINNFNQVGKKISSDIGDKPAAGFVDLSYNYLQEKLQDLFSTTTLEKLRAEQKPSEKVRRTKLQLHYHSFYFNRTGHASFFCRRLTRRRVMWFYRRVTHHSGVFRKNLPRHRRFASRVTSHKFSALET